MIPSSYGLLLGFTTITSGFGYRTHPVTGRHSFHNGLDIGAPTGSNIVSISNGVVIYTGFAGAGGFTVTIRNGNFTASYSHVSPNFIVQERTNC